MHKGLISKALDDRLTGEDLFGAIGPNYLGSHDVVGQLVADYCMLVRDKIIDVSAGNLSKEDFSAQINAERDRLAAVIAGEDAQYTPVAGWNSYTLGFRLRIELGQYWQQNREANDGNPYKAVFSWLCWAVMDAIQRSNNDQDLEQAILAPRTSQIIRLLLGSDRRVD